MKNKIMLILCMVVMFLSLSAGSLSYAQQTSTKIEGTSSQITVSGSANSNICNTINVYLKVSWNRLYGNYWNSFSTDSGYTSQGQYSKEVLTLNTGSSTGNYPISFDTGSTGTYAAGTYLEIIIRMEFSVQELFNCQGGYWIEYDYYYAFSYSGQAQPFSIPAHQAGGPGFGVSGNLNGVYTN